MDANELRALQAPLKDTYRSNPYVAVVTLKAQGRIGKQLFCRVETGKTLAEAGLHPATGGDGSLARSGDMLLEALVACTGVTLEPSRRRSALSFVAARSARKAILISAVR
jgi:hypothetical protein